MTTIDPTKTDSTTLIDIWLDVPKEGLEPELVKDYPDSLHLLFDRSAVEYAEQYRDALMMSRSLPFSLENVGVTDVLTLVIANTMNAKGKLVAQDAIRRAQATYQRWITQVEKEGWTLAILYDNIVTNEPTEYPTPKPPAPGISQIPEPKRSLIDPVERRLKSILDILNISIEFRSLAETTINNVLTELAQYGSAIDSGDHFRLPVAPASEPIPNNDGDVGTRKNSRSKRSVPDGQE